MSHKNILIEELKTAWEVATLKEAAMEKLAKDKGKTPYALGILGLGILLGLIGMSSGFGSMFFYLKLGVYQVVQAVGGIFLCGLIAVKLFKGKADYDAFLRVMGYGSVVSWLSLITMLSPIAGIWALVIAFVGLKKVYHLSTGAVIGSLLLTAIALGVLNNLLYPTLMVSNQMMVPAW